MGVPSSSKRNRWLARQASECQRNSSRIASIIARGQTGALYDRRVVLSSRDDDVFIKESRGRTAKSDSCGDETLSGDQFKSRSLLAPICAGVGLDVISGTSNTSFRNLCRCVA